MATEPLPDGPALRHGRRARAFAAMEAHDLDVLVLGRVANIRYLSGVPILWNAGTRPFGPGCVAVRSTREIFLLSTWDEGVPDDIPHDHLYGITWNPMNLVKVLQGIAAEAAPARVGTDAMSPLFAKLLPMAFPDAAIVDGGPALREARRIKTNEEVGAIQAAIGIAEGAMAVAVSELRPGVGERDLTGVFMEAMARSGVTTPATQEVVRITSENTVGRAVQAGDLVAFHAGVVAGGYVGEVGRTWPVELNGGASAGRDLYRRWGKLWAQLFDACQPGAPASALLDAYVRAGEPLPPMPIGRGLGLGFDDPVVVRDLPTTAAHDRLEPGMVLLITGCVAGDTGAVIASEPVLMTADGPQVLSSSPFWTPDSTGEASE